MNLYRIKKPYVNAIYFDGRNTKEVAKFSKGKLFVRLKHNGQRVAIEKDGNIEVARAGQWIVLKGTEFYPMSNEAFKSRYEYVSR